MRTETADKPERTPSESHNLHLGLPRRPAKPLDVLLREFWQRRDCRSFRAAADRALYDEEVPPELRRDLEAASWYATESGDWRLRAAGIDELYSISGQFARKADTIVAGLQARQETVRVSAWCAIDGVRLTRVVLARLERTPPSKLLSFEVLMGVDRMAEILSSPADRQRLIAFVKGLERQPRFPPLVAWKIGQTLYCDCPEHLDVEPDDGSIDADYWREYRRYPQPVEPAALRDFSLEPDAGYGRRLRRTGTGEAAE